jgi:hypothetical protein
MTINLIYEIFSKVSYYSILKYFKHVSRAIKNYIKISEKFWSNSVQIETSKQFRTKCRHNKSPRKQYSKSEQGFIIRRKQGKWHKAMN